MKNLEIQQLSTINYHNVSFQPRNERTAEKRTAFKMAVTWQGGGKDQKEMMI